MAKSTTKVERPLIREILESKGSTQNELKGNMSESDIAKMLAPLGELGKEELFVAMKGGQALGQHLNLKATKKVEEVFTAEYAKVVLAMVLGLKQSGNKIATLIDVPKGAMIEAQMPSDMFSLGGSIIFDVLDEGPTSVRVIGSSEVSGQMFDWGKGARAMKGIIDRAQTYLRRF